MLGEFNGETDVQLKIDFTNTVSPPGASNNIQIITYDHQLETNIDTYNTIITGSETVTIDYPSFFTIEDWDWRKLINLEFKIQNTYSDAGDYIWVNKIYLYVYYYYSKGRYGVGKKLIKIESPNFMINQHKFYR